MIHALWIFRPLVPGVAAHEFSADLGIETFPESGEVCCCLYRAMIGGQKMNDERRLLGANAWRVLHAEKVL